MGEVTREVTVEATHELARFVAGLSFEELGDVAVERAKMVLLDTLAVAVAATPFDEARAVADVVLGSSSGLATVIGYGRTAAPEAAAFVNGTLAHFLDFDERGHAAPHVLPAVLAVAEELDSSGSDVLGALVVGREVRLRLGAVHDAGRFQLDGAGPGDRGWHSTSTVGSLGSAAGAAKILDLDVDRLRTAFGIAGSLASGLVANFGTTTKPIHAGNAARNGVLSARLARGGVGANTSILSSRRGFFDAFGMTADDLETFVGSLDGTLMIEGSNEDKPNGIRLKRYPSCTATHRYIDAVRAELGASPIEVDDVDAIVCTKSQSLTFPFPTNGTECRFSAPFAIAATIIDGAVTLPNCSIEFLYRVDVQSLLAKTTEVPQESPGWVMIRTRDGVEHRRAISPNPANLETYDEVVGKFMMCTEPVIGDERARLVVEAVDKLEQQSSIRELVSHLSP